MGLKMATGVSRTVAFYSLAFKIEPYKKKKPAPAVIVFPIGPLDDIFNHADICEANKHIYFLKYIKLVISEFKCKNKYKSSNVRLSQVKITVL